jgi:hypothetical protein
MSTTKLEHRLALALYARNQASEGTWAHQFWSVTAWHLERKRGIDEANIINRSDTIQYDS